MSSFSSSSSSSINRQRDRSAGKSRTPSSVPNKAAPLKRSSSGKENSALPVTRSQKPTIRPVPRVEKLASDGVRRSTSSVPRGRSQSPSEFIRVYSDLKKDRVSVEKKRFRDLNVKGAELGGSERRISSDFKENIRVGVNSEKKSDTERGSVGVRKSCNSVSKGVNLRSDSGTLTRNSSGSGKFESSSEKGSVGFRSKGEHLVKVTVSKPEAKIEKSRVSADLGSKEADLKSLGGSKELDIVKEKGLSEGGSVKAEFKYSSKLHEKLSFLEGKVKRIASDIKKTKEMLDMNNTDASKVILSDIQEKISGIEKAMGNVVGNSDGTGSSKTVGSDDVGCDKVEKNHGKEVAELKNPAKELQAEELEARLFPHHKLLKSRMTLKTSSKSSGSHNSDVAGPSHDSKEEQSMSAEEKSIASEFLASLDKGTAGDEQVDFDCCEILETDSIANSGENVTSNRFSDKGKDSAELLLMTDERLEDFDDQENTQGIMIGEEADDSCLYQLNEIGQKTSTGGWFVSEGESVLLTHDDGSCSFYDITNCEVCFFTFFMFMSLSLFPFYFENWLYLMINILAVFMSFDWGFTSCNCFWTSKLSLVINICSTV